MSLDFELRATDLFFREVVVPELGRIWFARQLSWPLAALAIHEELASQGSNAPKPTAICHGVEAFARKPRPWFEDTSMVGGHPGADRHGGGGQDAAPVGMSRVPRVHQWHV
jgi:hypothetical protein